MDGNEIERQHHQTFEQLRRSNHDKTEFWYARELQVALDYASWDKFQRVIKKAMVACETSGHPVDDHFSQVGKMVDLGSGSQRKVVDYELSRYACYLIVQNGNPSKPVIANGQTYFAMQTRRQELADDAVFQKLKEDEKRLFLRNELREHNKQLVESAQQAGVESSLDFAIFQNHGYKGLYGGLDAKAIHARKGIRKNQQILDHMGSTELAANLFRATQTDEKLRRDKVQGKEKANQTHYEVGKKSVKPSRNSAAPCLKTFRRPKQVSKPSRQTPRTLSGNYRGILGSSEGGGTGSFPCRDLLFAGDNHRGR